MTDRDILEAAEQAKQEFGAKCRKFSGTVTVELIRRALQEAGVAVSARDVFIRGIPIEIDLIIPKKDAIPLHGLVYDPADVLAAVEVKHHGSFGSETIEKLRANFAMVKQANPRIRCCYLTLIERETYKWRVTSENCGGEAYAMFWYKTLHKQADYDSTGDWDRFVNSVKEAGGGPLIELQ